MAKLETNVSRRRTNAGAILLQRVARHYDGVAKLEQEKMAYSVSGWVLCVLNVLFIKLSAVLLRDMTHLLKYLSTKVN